MTNAPAPRIFDRKLHAQNRERAASATTIPDFLLARVGEDFAERLAVIKRRFPDALNLSAATGALVTALQQQPGIDTVVSTEVSSALAGRLPPPAVVADEEALPFAPSSFDLIVSALTLQFANDLPGVLTQVRQTLKPDGLFLGALIGGQSLTELRQATLAAETEIHGGASPRVAPFADVRDLGGLLQRAGFALPVADSDVVTVTYANPLELMRELKAMGAGNALAERSRRPATRALLVKIAEVYTAQFAGPDGRIPATFEILTMTGWAPHRSQQQPLYQPA